MKRRDFLKNTVLAATALQFPHIWVKNTHADAGLFKLTILQTNDTHSRIDPFPLDGGRNQGLGGIARRATLINRIRRQNPNTLLVDAGDVLQGTPYFNMYKGKIEYETMTRCRYDASTLGNHEFDNGVDSLAEVLQYANFDIVNCNFDFGDSALAPGINTYITRQVGPIKVGITGVGIDFADLVAPQNHTGVSYKHPYKPLQSVVTYLRRDLGCSLVVVLSHLGLRYNEPRPSDEEMALRVNGVDWIVGGHTHTFMKEPLEILSKNRHTTRILQVGWAGILLGKTDFYFDGQKLVAVKSDPIQVNATLDGNFNSISHFS
jgi:5'-nucleotidase